MISPRHRGSKPDPVTVEQMRQHILRLCEAREYHVTCCARPRQSYALREAEEIQIAPIKSALSYATALHEVGHLEGRHPNSKRVMVRERWAWATRPSSSGRSIGSGGPSGPLEQPLKRLKVLLASPGNGALVISCRPRPSAG